MKINIFPLLKCDLSKKYFIVTLFFICIIGIYLRTKVFLFNNSFFIDEISLANNILKSTYFDLFKPLEYGQVAPPFFTMLSKFILDFSGQINDVYNRELVLRLFPFLSSVLSVPLFIFFVNRNFQNKYFTIISSLFFSLNHTLIGYAAEFKQYSVELFCSILLLLLFSSINIEKDSVRRIIFYLFLICLVQWFSFSSFFVLISGFIYLTVSFINNNFQRKLKYSILISGFILHSLFYYIVVVAPYLDSSYQMMYSCWANEGYSFFTLENFSKMFLMKTAILFSIFRIPEVSIILFFAFASIFIYRKSLKDIILIGGPILFMIIASCFELYPYERRFLVFLIPMFLIIYSSFVYLLKETKLTDFVIYFSVVFILISQVFVRPSTFVINLDDSRRLYVEMKKLDSVLDNIFVAESNGYIYYSAIDTTMSAKHILFSNEPLNVEEIDKKISELNSGSEYWVFSPVSSMIFDTQIKDYFLRNNQISVINIIESSINDSSFILKFRKN